MRKIWNQLECEEVVCKTLYVSKLLGRKTFFKVKKYKILTFLNNFTWKSDSEEAKLKSLTYI